jgi:hypothetical protein
VTSSAIATFYEAHCARLLERQSARLVHDACAEQRVDIVIDFRTQQVGRLGDGLRPRAWSSPWVQEATNVEVSTETQLGLLR